MAMAEDTFSPSKCTRSLLFALNGRRVEIASPDPAMTLLTFLRSHAGLTGTKLSCGEGGCGACLVLLSTYDPKSKRVEESSINSCLALLCSLDGCSITTIEGLGSTRASFHTVQQRIAGFHGSQCGFCTPGMCISLYSCLRNSTCSAPIAIGTHLCDPSNDKHIHDGAVHTIHDLSSADAQKAIVGNICRCTGYRPIIDACKSFAGDVDVEDLGVNTFWTSTKEASLSLLPPYSRIADPTFPEFLIEELHQREKIAHIHAHDKLEDAHCSSKPALPLNITFRDSGPYGEERAWIQTNSLEEVFKALQFYQGRSDVKLVVGNTSSGYYKDHNYRVFIDISTVPELLILQETSGFLKVGAAISIQKLIRALDAIPHTSSSVVSGLVSHLRKVANPHVRHRASIGGNLIMAQRFYFDSDLVTLFLAIGATLQLIGAGKKISTLDLEDFLHIGSLEPGLLLECISLPLWFSDRSNASCMGNGSSLHQAGINGPTIKKWFKSYRAAPRDLGNSLAYINAAFLADTSPSGLNACCKVVNVRLAFGAFGQRHAMRAHKVERFLTGQDMNASVLLDAINILKDELGPVLKGTKKSSYKLSVAVGYLFDFLWPLLPNYPMQVSPGIGSTKSKHNGSSLSKHNGELGSILSSEPFRGISGRQNVPDYKEDTFIGKPVEKSEAKIQASGLVSFS